MKTLNRKTETGTSSKLKNLLLRSGAIMLSVFLIGSSLNAQGNWKQLFTEESLGSFAMIQASDASVNSSNENLMNNSSPTETNMDASNFHIETENDKPLSVEEWMTGEDYFFEYSLDITNEKDKELNLQEWMKSSEFFKTTNELDQEADLKIEDWMITDNFWNI